MSVTAGERIRVGEVIHVGSEDGTDRKAIVVGSDAAGNPEIIPLEAGADKAELARYVGPQRAHQLWTLVQIGQELGV